MDIVELKIKEEQSGSIARHPWEIARVKVIRNILLSMFKSDDELTFLDIGCGDVFLISQLSLTFQRASFIAVDTAFDEDLLNHYRNNYDSNRFSFYTSMEDLNLSSEKRTISAVLLLDVIEHIREDISFLSELRAFELLDENTKICITVPAFQSIFSEHDVVLGHYRRYSNKTLSMHVEQAGLSSHKVGYFFTALLMVRALQVLLDKWGIKKLESKGVAAWQHGKAVTSIFVNVLYFDYLITKSLSRIGIKLPGLSNFIICSK